MVLDELAARAGVRLSPGKGARSRAVSGEGRLAGRRVVLARPLTYMNESGGPVKSLMTFYRVRNDHLVVVHDELDLPFGGIRVKLGGGDNGHNGLRSIRAAIGTGDYNRVRVGIGRPMDRVSTTDHVLGQFSPGERSSVSLLAAHSADAVASLLSSGLEATQQSFNNARST